MMNSQQPSSKPIGLLVNLRRNLRRSGLRQIDAAIAQLDQQLQDRQLTAVDRLVIMGQRRELRAARWCVERLLVSAQPSAQPSTQPLTGDSSRASPSNPRNFPAFVPDQPSSAPSLAGEPLATDRLAGPGFDSPVGALSVSGLAAAGLSASGLAPSNLPASGLPTAAHLRSLQAALFDGVFARLQGNLRNLTETPLEIDILREDKKRELLVMVLRKLEEGLDDLRYSQVSLESLSDKRLVVLVNIWQATTADFFGRYYSLPVGNSPSDNLRQPPVDLVEVLQQDGAIVEAEILAKIPLVTEFLAHLLFGTPLLIDDTLCGVGTVEAMARMELLLQNLMLQIANAVMQPLLNRFGNVVAVKQNFYDKRLLSTREIERFRNNLSWRYRVEKYFGEPAAIFESRYTLFTLEPAITKTSIYAPRNQELDDLAGVRLAVTLALETRDAIAPRLQTTISFLGSGVVYLLTEVIGRGLGLIGRGILKGIGNSLQTPKM